METDWFFLLLDFCCHCLDHRNRRWWKKVNTRPLPSMSSKDDITTTSNMEMPFQQIARPSKYNSWPLQTRYILSTVTQCTLYIPLAKGTANSNHKCQPQVRKGLKKPPLSLTQKSNPKRITLKGCAHLLPWLTFLQFHWSWHPPLLSWAGNTPIGGRILMSYVCPVAPQSGTSKLWLHPLLFQTSVQVKGAIFWLTI